MIRFFSISLFLLVILFISSCYYDNYEDLYRNFPEEDCDTVNTTFSATVLPTLSTNCAISGCHAGASPQSNLNLAQYSDVKTIAEDDRLLGRMTGTSGPIMPPTGILPECDIEQVKAWVRKGARNN